MTEVQEGLREIRRLVSDTHWIQGSYISVEYLDGDGEYADGAIVEDRKVVGCLVGLSRLVAAKQPTVTRTPINREDLPPRNPLAMAMEAAMQETIIDEFSGDEYMFVPEDLRDEDEDDSDEEPEHDRSIENWNDRLVRTREHVLQMLDRAIERTAVQEANA